MLAVWESHTGLPAAPLMQMPEYVGTTPRPALLVAGRRRRRPTTMPRVPPAGTSPSTRTPCSARWQDGLYSTIAGGTGCAKGGRDDIQFDVGACLAGVAGSKGGHELRRDDFLTGPASTSLITPPDSSSVPLPCILHSYTVASRLVCPTASRFVCPAGKLDQGPPGAV